MILKYNRRGIGFTGVGVVWWWWIEPERVGHWRVGLAVSVDGSVAVGAETPDVPLVVVSSFLVESMAMELSEPGAGATVLVGGV
jgi:hypothetical protein